MSRITPFEARLGILQPALLEGVPASAASDRPTTSPSGDGVDRGRCGGGELRIFAKVDALLARARAENIRFSGEACLRAMTRYDATGDPADLARLNAALRNLRKVIHAARSSQDFRSERALGHLEEPLGAAVTVLSNLLAQCTQLAPNADGASKSSSLLGRVVSLLHPDADAAARAEARELLTSIQEILATATWLEAPLGLWRPPGLEPRTEPTRPAQIYPEDATSTQTRQKFPEALQHHLAAEVALHEGAVLDALGALIDAARVLTTGPEHGENAAVAVALTYIADAIQNNRVDAALEAMVPELYLTAAFQANRLLGTRTPMAVAIRERANGVLRDQGHHDRADRLTEASLTGQAPAPDPATAVSGVWRASSLLEDLTEVLNRLAAAAPGSLRGR